MMGHVVEQRPDGQQDPEQPGDEIASGSAVEPARPQSPAPQDPAEPPELDPEQARQFEQFRQFQQFQEFQRFQEAQRQAGTDVVPGQPYPPVATTTQDVVPRESGRQRPKVPGWLQWLGKKLIGWLIFFILLAIALTWAYNYFFGTGDSDDNAAQMGGGTYHTNELLSDKPYEAVRQVYDAIAQEDPDTGRPLVAQACGRFDNQRGIQQRFAENLGYQDCRRAVLALHDEVTHVNDYAESIYPRHYDLGAKTLRINSCEFTIEGGPALGTFVVTRQEYENQWLITGHERGPKTCPSAPASPSRGG